MDLSDRWLSVDEVAQYLGISKETLYRWLEKKKIPAHRIGKLWKFQLSEVESWIKSGKQQLVIKKELHGY
ncbi:MAG: helix-turn-helix domain-containing protein [Bacteriovorax sp.]|jgi:excisionase family DNA binding protein